MLMHNDFRMVENPNFDLQVKPAGQANSTVLGYRVPQPNPRNATTTSHAAWEEAIQDASLHAGIEHVLNVLEEPTMEKVYERYAMYVNNMEQLEQIFHACVAKDNAGSMQLYLIVRPSLDISGAHAADDLDYIRKNFQSGGIGVRDGCGLIKWVRRFANKQTLKAQTTLRTKVDAAAISSACTLTQLETHSKGLLRDWAEIESNILAEPKAFYHRLVQSIK